MVKIVFTDSHGRVHTEGMIGYLHDYDTFMEEIESGLSLEELGAMLDFVKEHFAPDYWEIKDGKVQRFSAELFKRGWTECSGSGVS